MEHRPGLAGLREEHRIAGLGVRAGEERRVEQAPPLLERLHVDAGDVGAGLQQVHLGLARGVLLLGHQRAAGQRLGGQHMRIPRDERRVAARAAEPLLRARRADLVDDDIRVVVEAPEVGIGVVAGQEDAQLELDQVAGLQRAPQRRRSRDLLDEHELAVVRRHGEVDRVVAARVGRQRVVVGDRRLQLLAGQQRARGQQLHAAVVAVQCDGRRAWKITVAAADVAGAEVGAVQPPLRTHHHRQDVLRRVRGREVVVDRDLVGAALEVVRGEQVVQVVGAGRVARGGLLARMAVAHASAELRHQGAVGQRVLRGRIGLRPAERRESLRRDATAAAGARSCSSCSSRSGASTRTGTGSGTAGGRSRAGAAARLAAAAGRKHGGHQQQAGRRLPAARRRAFVAFHEALSPGFVRIPTGVSGPGRARRSGRHSVFVKELQIPCPMSCSSRLCRIQMKVSGRRRVEPVPFALVRVPAESRYDEICHPPR